MDAVVSEQTLNIDCLTERVKINSLLGLGSLKSLLDLRIQNVMLDSGNPIDLTPLSNLKELNYLSLYKTSFKSLEPLYELKSLKEIFIGDNITTTLKKEIEENMPWCILN